MPQRKKHSLPNNESAIEWYAANRYLYKELANKVNVILEELLKINAIGIHAIFNRAKDVESFKDKIKDPKYTDPQSQITDLAGIRVICYVESDIAKICKVIEDDFEIDRENSGDKSKLLGTNKVGYKSVHYVAELNISRLVLPEYKNYRDMKFEIQIRTILQHAWAEIEHDRNYKFSGELPEEIQRRFMLIAGSLELADREFDKIAADIDKISEHVKIGTKEGNLEFELNTTTLKQFVATKFEEFTPERIKYFSRFQNSEFKILKELNRYGLKSLNDLNEIIPANFNAALKKANYIPQSFIFLLRVIMIIHDWKKYFEKSYSHDWDTGVLKKYDFLVAYDLPMEEILKFHD